MKKFYDGLVKKTVLPSGLCVYVAQMPEFAGVHALYGTDFGSADRDFEHNAERISLPAGTAHFLEHKMFENETEDAFTLYAKTGACANAYTSFDKTCYLFSATENIQESLDILLSFVSKPYFTEKTVEKEQGIISQEINMYVDNSEWRLFFGVLAGLYVNHPLKDDIAGTIESIKQITPQLLYKCTDAFYAKDNMVLSVAGNIKEEQVLEACKKAGLYQPQEKNKTTRIALPEPQTVAIDFAEIELSIGIPIIGIGFKEQPFPEKDQQRMEMVCSILLEMICGCMTPLYRKMYDTGLISGDISCESISGRDYLCFIFSAETREPRKFEEMLCCEIERLKSEGVSKEMFTAVKKGIYGDLIEEFDSPDDVATMMTTAFFKKREPFSDLSICEYITYEETIRTLKILFSKNRKTTFIINPIKE